MSQYEPQNDQSTKFNPTQCHRTSSQELQLLIRAYDRIHQLQAHNSTLIKYNTTLQYQNTQLMRQIQETNNKLFNLRLMNKHILSNLKDEQINDKNLQKQKKNPYTIINTNNVQDKIQMKFSTPNQPCKRDQNKKQIKIIPKCTINRSITSFSHVNLANNMNKNLTNRVKKDLNISNNKQIGHRKTPNHKNQDALDENHSQQGIISFKNNYNSVLGKNTVSRCQIANSKPTIFNIMSKVKLKNDQSTCLQENTYLNIQNSRKTMINLSQHKEVAQKSEKQFRSIKSKNINL